MIFMKDIFSSGGVLSAFHERYEERTQQIEMAEFIEEILFETGMGLAEAGTGTGKSLAYTIPLMMYAKNEKAQVAVSTETRALQKQLVEYEAPLAAAVVEKCTGEPVNWALCLGSSNYLCRYRFESSLTAHGLMVSSLEKLQEIQSMIAADKIVSRFDLQIADSAWNEINKLPDACLGKRCPFRDCCSYKKAKEKWMAADFLIINHYLFFANIASNGSVLPALDALIFDEAHGLEDICSQQFGYTLDENEALEILSLVCADSRKLPVLQRLFPAKDREHLRVLGEEAQMSCRKFFASIAGAIAKDRPFVILREPFDSAPPFYHKLDAIIELINDMEDDLADSLEGSMTMDFVRGKLFTMSENIKIFIHQYKKRYVYWVERNQSQSVSLHFQPLDVANIMRHSVLPLYRSLVFVSATLSVGKNFSYIERRLGIDEAKQAVISSPFNYEEQVLLYLPRQIAQPDDAAYEEDIYGQIKKVAAITHGRVLVLFTSYAFLRAMAARLKKQGYDVIAQGDMTAADAVAAFRNREEALLLGTDSMWQGIDLPGDLLRVVIIPRLPFEVPDTPVNKMRMEYLAIQGIDPFRGYLLPQAVIAFKQGFGRLIRSTRDKGIAAILDQRIHNRRYGPIFISSLPKCQNISTLDNLTFYYEKFLEK